MPMTIEEAGQVLLENLPILICQACKGQSWMKKDAEVGDPVSLTEDGKTMVIKDCGDCKGVGHFLKPEYAEACSVLNMEVPKEIKLLTETPWVKRMQISAAAAYRIPVGYITGVAIDGPDTVRVVMNPESTGIAHSERIYSFRSK